MAYLKGGTVVDGDLTVEGELKVSGVNTNTNLVGKDSYGNTIANDENGLPTTEPTFWVFS